mmetsp:Transcript_108586/g.203747  ORF Transcript_108586/g.203747 Transcript_108586/m.203747 type:complete len:83 (-) Transcript_108586:7-255(-)
MLVRPSTALTIIDELERMTKMKEIVGVQAPKSNMLMLFSVEKVITGVEMCLCKEPILAVLCKESQIHLLRHLKSLSFNPDNG